MRKSMLTKLAVWLSMIAILTTVVYVSPSDSASAETPPPTTETVWYAKISWLDAIYNLGGGHTGTIETEFDVTPLINNTSVVMGYSDTDTNVTTYSHLNAIMTLTNAGIFNVRDGTIYRALSDVPYIANNTYHVKTLMFLDQGVYDVWVTPPGGAETKIAENFAFRTGAPAIDDIGKMVLKSDAGENDAKVENHTITSSSATPIPTPTPPPAVPAATPGPDGWTPITTFADTRIVYVSSSGGNDSNDGLTESTPVKTITKGASLVRHGFPDQLLLKTGDVWQDESLGTFKSGRSPGEPIVIGYYGTSPERPKVRISSDFIDHNGQTRSYLTIRGIEFVNYRMDPTEPLFNADKSTGFRLVGSGDHILFEDVKLNYVGIDVEGYAGIYSNFKLRRSIILNNYAPSSYTSTARAAGIYASHVDGILIEENVFDHNGWSEVVPTAGANQFSHNIYLSAENVGNNVKVKGNILARGSSHGVHGRPGGLYEDNLVVNNSIGLQMGYSGSPLGAGTFATARNNVITEGKKMDANTSYPRTPAVWGLPLADLGNGTVTLDGNIVANSKDPGNMGISNDAKAVYLNNIQYDWYSGTSTVSLKDTFDPTWLDPERSVGSYYGSLGGSATLDAFLTDAANRGLHQWPGHLTANAASNYIRAGFNVAPVDDGVSDIPDVAPTPTPVPTPTPDPTPTPAPTPTTETVWYAKTGWIAATYNLGGGHTGTLETEFDVTPLVNNTNVVIGYSDIDTNVGDYSKLNAIMTLSSTGLVNVRDGADYKALAVVPYSANETYHVKMLLFLEQGLYDVWITPPGGVETKIAENFAFRTGAPAMDDVGKMIVKSDAGNNNAKVENHTITSSTATPIPTPTPPPPVPGATPGPDGWTPITTYADTKIVYVSSSEGNDSNDGLSESTPVKTIAKGATLVRDGFPDQLLLKTGDVWQDESLGRFKSGRSPGEPIVVGYYGTSSVRPKVRVSSNFIDHDGQIRSYITIRGIELINYKKDPTDPAFNGNTSSSLRFIGGGNSILLEDLKLQYVDIVVQDYGGMYTNFALRRSIIVNNYALNSFTTTNRASGIYATHVDGLLIEENLFDHNGWSEVVATAGANMFSHNIYLSDSNIGNNVKVKGNIIARGSSHGVHGRPGGLYEDNLVVNNSIGLQMGYAGSPLAAGTFATARNNVILEGKKMHPTNTGYPRTPAVWGLPLADLGEGTVTLEGNIVAHRLESGSNMGISNDAKVVYLNNIQYDWYSGTSTVSLKDTSDPTWLDPERSVGSYNGTLGGTATLDAFLKDAANRGLHEWPREYSANAVNNYIREGFNRPAVDDGYELTDTISPVTVAAASPDAPDGDNGWYTSEVTLSLSATDDLSGVATTEYQVNGGDWIAYTGSIPIFGEGVYSIGYRSTDTAGNVEATQTIEFKIDTTNPELTIELDKTEIWPPNNNMVTINATLNASDATSGVASVVLTSITSNEPDDGDIDANIGSTDTAFQVRAERLGSGTGRIYTIVYTVTDSAGNQSFAETTVTVPHNQ